MSVRLPRAGLAARAALVVGGLSLALLPLSPAQAAAPSVVPATKVTHKTAMSLSCKTFSTAVAWRTSAVATYTKVKKGKKSTVVIRFSPNYHTGPVPIAAKSLRPVLTLKVDGKVRVVSGTPNGVAVGPNTTLPPTSVTFSFTAKTGTNTVLLSKVVWHHPLVDTTCTMPKAATVASFKA